MKRFTKKALPLAIAAAMVPGFASAADVSGYADIIYTIADDAADVPGGTNPNNGKFGASGEIDFTASLADGVTVRMDVDLSLGSTCTSTFNGLAQADSVSCTNAAQLEQAYFAWGATEGLTVLGGVFNNPIGKESQNDAPDLWGTNRGVVATILDGQTALYDNNVAGLAGAFAAGPATFTLALLNDLGQVDEKNSFAAVVNLTPIEGLDVEVGYVTQDNDTTAAGNVIDVNLAYATPVEGLSVGLDYLAPAEIIDAAYEVTLNYDLTDMGLGFGVRAESVAWAASGADDSTRTTFHVSYAAASNLTAILEVASGDDANPVTAVTGIQADNLTTLELIATF